MKGIYWLYIIGPEEGWPVKVGFTANMRNRFACLQTGYWQPLALHKRYAVVSKSSAMKLERLVHKRLRESGKELLGEWFNLFADDAIKAVEDAMEYQKYLGPSLKIMDNLEENICA